MGLRGFGKLLRGFGQKSNMNVPSHSLARGLCDFHIGLGLLEPLIHCHLGATVTMVLTLIKSHVFFNTD
jgi:hypothetical protein